MLNLINNRKSTEIAAKEFVNNLYDDIYIIGCNKYGISLAKWLKISNKNVVGFIDDFTSARSFEGLPILKSNSNFSGAAIINCSVEGQSINVRNLIRKTNAAKSTDYFILESAFPEYLLPIDYFSETGQILDHKDLYDAVFELLADVQSKQEFEAVLNFRINRKLDFLSQFKFRVLEQYFEDFISLGVKCNFVDAGGFDGFTSLEFAKKYHDYGKIFYFEPTLASFKLSKTTLANTRDVVYFQNGLWDKTDTLRFNNDMGNSSRITEEGKDEINVVSMDEVIKERVAFIKIDIEGAEQKALEGARGIIKKWKPIIAVCVYHKQSDMVEIPNYLLNIHPNYQLYFRHYTQGTCESVMYFV